MKTVSTILRFQFLAITMILGLGSAVPGAVLANDTLVLDQRFKRASILPYARLFIDSTGRMGLADIRAAEAHFNANFPSSFPFSYPTTYWLHFKVQSVTAFEGTIVFPGDSIQDYVEYALDYLDFYMLDAKGELIRNDRSGYYVKKSEKAIKANPLVTVVPFKADSNQLYDCFVRLQNVHYPLHLPLRLELRHQVVKPPTLDHGQRWIILGPWGMYLIISLYVLVLYYYVRDPAFLAFGIFALLYSHNLLALEPDGNFICILPEHPRLGNTLFCISLYSIFTLLWFGKLFIKIKEHFPKWHPYYVAIMGLVGLITTYYVIRSFWMPVLSVQTGVLFSLLLVLPFCIRFYFSSNWPAKIFAVGIFSFLGGNVLGVLATMSGHEEWSGLVWVTGNIILLFVNALALGYRFLEIERVRATNEKIQELDKLKSRFFTNISHEFRTPLSLILGPLQQAEEAVPQADLEDSENDIPIRVGHLQVMKRNGIRLLQLINQILDLSKLESGKMTLELKQGNIIAFLRTRIAEFKDVAAAKNIHLITQYPNENEWAYYDMDKLEKILSNILGNALKYTPPQGQIRVDMIMSSQQLTVSVSDTGPGMTLEEANHIFDRFYQTDAAVQQGSGIGLALVKELVELQKGQITVESQLGTGTTITFTIGTDPALYSPADFAVGGSGRVGNSGSIIMADQPSSSFSSIAFKEGNPLVLVVEDNRELQAFIHQILREKFNLLQAFDGIIGKEMAVEHLPDLILSDVMMPGMSGFDLCKFIKSEEKTSHIPVILLTAKSGQVDKLIGLEQGADDYISKPFDPKELALKISNAIQSREKLRERFKDMPWQVDSRKLESMDEQFLQHTMEHVQANLANEYYSVEALAEDIGYSRSQLFRKLKALTGKSPIDLIKGHRMHHAKSLLAAKAMTVSEVAYAVGYSNVSYFSQSFKKEFGKSPSSFLP